MLEEPSAPPHSKAAAEGWVHVQGRQARKRSWGAGYHLICLRGIDPVQDALNSVQLCVQGLNALLRSLLGLERPQCLEEKETWSGSDWIRDKKDAQTLSLSFIKPAVGHLQMVPGSPNKIALGNQGTLPAISAQELEGSEKAYQLLLSSSACPAGFFFTPMRQRDRPRWLCHGTGCGRVPESPQE